MAKKYLSLNEAAEMLQMDPEALKQLRADGEIRGFADRGTWKFRSEDVENLIRSRQADSDPEVPILGSADEDVANVLDDSDPGEDPTIIRKSDEDLSRSDSDVRLIVDDSISLADSDPDLSIVDGSDSDVTLGNTGDEPEIPSGSGALSGTGLLAGSVGELDTVDLASDSDVQLIPASSGTDGNDIGVTSDSDVRLTGDDIDAALSPDSDSDVQLVDVAPEGASSDSVTIPTDTNVASDSDVVLPNDAGVPDSDSDVILADDDALSLDFDDDGDDAGASVLLGDADDSGITLEEGSGLLLSGDSGINLEGASDSGISLEMDDEGITLADDDTNLSAVGDSGISLEGDSGIALADEVEDAATMGEMAAFDDDDGIPETQFEIPAEGADSEFDLDVNDTTSEFDVEDDDETAEFDLSDSFDSETAEFELDDDDISDVSDFDSLDAASVADIDLLEGDDAFDDESFESEAGAGGSYGGIGIARSAPVRQEWDTLFVGFTMISLAVMLLAAFISFDLLTNIYSWNSAEPNSGVIVDSLSGLLF